MRSGDGRNGSIKWGAARRLHALDYSVLLPSMAHLPLAVGYLMASLRGWLNGLVGRDWRSMELGTRQVARQSAAGYRMLFPEVPEVRVHSLVRQRFTTESREEFEGRLIVASQVHRLRYAIDPEFFLAACRNRDRGLVLLTPHFDSFILGVVFLGLAGVRINLMSSVGSSKTRIHPAVYRHFFEKYAHMERYLSGGRVLPLEHGLRPFYQMLERKECVVVLADVPPIANGVSVTPTFLGAKRTLAGGALRIARNTGSDLGAFVCRFEGRRDYRVEGSAILNAGDPRALEAAYTFLSGAIAASPGRWWAADLLPAMPVIEVPPPRKGDS